MRGFVGNTDFDWYSFLKERQPLDEVNFWQPSGSRSFRVLQPGDAVPVGRWVDLRPGDAVDRVGDPEGAAALHDQRGDPAVAAGGEAAGRGLLANW